MEEDIKILEEYLGPRLKNLCNCEFGYEVIRGKELEAIANLIKGYRELEEQIDKHVYFETTNPKEIEKNFIPKSKIKEKLEELEHEKFKRTYLGFFSKNNCENRILLAKIQVLQELKEDK